MVIAQTIVASRRPAFKNSLTETSAEIIRDAVSFESLTQPVEVHVKIRTCLLAMSLAVTAHMVHAQGGAAQPGQPAEVRVTTTRLGGSVYAVDGQGGRMAALIGPEGVFLVDAQFPAVTEKIVAAIREISPAPI